MTPQAGASLHPCDGFGLQELPLVSFRRRYRQAELEVAWKINRGEAELKINRGGEDSQCDDDGPLSNAER